MVMTLRYKNMTKAKIVRIQVCSVAPGLGEVHPEMCDAGRKGGKRMEKVKITRENKGKDCEYVFKNAPAHDRV